MTNGDKAIAIIKAIRDIVNDDKQVSFTDDWGGNSLTVFVSDGEKSSHTHCGMDDGPLADLLDNLHGALCGGPHLSWHTEDISPNLADANKD